MITASTVALQASSRGSIPLASTKYILGGKAVPAISVEDQLQRIRELIRQMNTDATLLGLALDSAESCSNSIDREIKQRAKTIVSNSKN